MTTHRIAAFPPRILKDRNPYARLLYRELDTLGFETVDADPLKLEWLWRSRRDVHTLHFHWDPQQRYVVREDDTVASLLRRIRQDNLVPWWELVSFVTMLATARTLGYRLAWTIHEIQPHESEHSRQDLLASRALARFSHVLLAHDAATADRARDELSLSREEIHVVPHGSYIGEYPTGRDREAVRSELGIPSDAFVFLAFGHLRAYKELSLLTQALASLESPPVRLMIAGVPWSSDIRAEVADAAARDPRIHLMLEAVPQENVAELFGASDVAVFPRSDGWTSGSLILAMSMGIPIIAARRATYETLMNGEQSGWFFDPGSAASLAASMSQAAIDPESARKKGDTAFELATRMSWGESAAMTAQLVAPLAKRA